jgi:anti-sigma factor RsiW
MCRREISRLLDGESDSSSVQELERHLALCEDCRKVRERMIGLNEQIRSLAPESPPAALAAIIKDRVADDRDRAVSGRAVPGWVRAGLFVMIVMSAVSLGNLAGRSVEEILSADRTGGTIEEIVMDRSPSFADALTDATSEERKR